MFFVGFAIDFKTFRLGSDVTALTQHVKKLGGNLIVGGPETKHKVKFNPFRLRTGKTKLFEIPGILKLPPIRGWPHNTINYNAVFSFDIAFGNPKIVKRVPVIPFLRQRADLVDGIVTQFDSLL